MEGYRAVIDRQQPTVERHRRWLSRRSGNDDRGNRQGGSFTDIGPSALEIDRVRDTQNGRTVRTFVHDPARNSGVGYCELVDLTFAFGTVTHGLMSSYCSIKVSDREELIDETDGKEWVRSLCYAGRHENRIGPLSLL